MDMEAAIRQLQETVTVVVGVQARQAEVLKGHGEWVESLQLQQARHAEFVQRHEQIMAEIDDKLNALIDYVDRMRPPNGRQEKQ